MSSGVGVLARGAGARREDASRAWLEAPAAALTAFAATASLAVMSYASLLSARPAARVLAIVAVASLLGAALAASGRLHGRAAKAGRLAAVLLAGYASLRLAGVPARLLWPSRWTALARELGKGIGALDGLWPYVGASAAARTAVMLVPAAVLPAAAALVFWPQSSRAPGRRVLALGLLLAVYELGAVNERQAGWQWQGVLLLALLGLWAWAWWPRLHDRGAALSWLAAGTVLALLGAGVLRSGTGLIDFRDWNPFGPVFPARSFDWNQSYGPRTWPNSGETMVEVAASAPRLWRATTLDRFDGTHFVRSATPPLDSGGLAGVRPDRAWFVRASFTVRGLDGKQLLTPGVPLDLASGAAGLRRDAVLAGDGSLSTGSAPASGVRYTITAYAPQPRAARLRAAPSWFPAPYDPYVEFQLPHGTRGAPLLQADAPDAAAAIEASPYAGVFALARRLQAGTHGSYEVVRRIEAYLRRGFVYDERPPVRPYPLAAFLLRDREGYCQQFSGAMTLLLRMNGIPARVAAGFQTGSRDGADGRWLVTARDAHSWVEVYFAGIGWVAFDPTPAAPRVGLPAIAAAARGGVGSGASASSGPSSARLGRLAPRANARVSSAPGASAAVLAGALAAAFAVLALAGAWIARGRRRAAPADAGAGAAQELLRAARAAGVELAPGITLSELERRLARSHGAVVAGYARMLRERRFAARPDPARPTARDRRMLRRALCAGRGPLARIRAVLAIPPWPLVRRR